LYAVGCFFGTTNSATSWAPRIGSEREHAIGAYRHGFVDPGRRRTPPIAIG
jgi:hypothetical protein